MKNTKFLTTFSFVAILFPTLVGCQQSGNAQSSEDIKSEISSQMTSESSSEGGFHQVYDDDPEDVDLSTAIELNADFAKTVDPALVKKVQMYNAGCIQPVENYERDMHLAKGLNPESLRIDVSLGKEDGQGGMYLVTDDYEIYDYDEETETYKVDKDSLHFDFSTLDNTLTYFKEMDAIPYLSWCYIPNPLGHNGEFRNLENNITNWQEVWEECYYNYAKYYKDQGVQIGYHEMYNEPDLEILKLWGTFDKDDNYFLDVDDFAPNGNPAIGCYPDMYEYGVKGILRADPDATVGGPAFAMGELGVEDWVGFFPRVRSKRLQMDFYSFHSYLDGSTWFMSEKKRNRGDKNELEKVVDGLQSDTLFLTTDVHINEFTPVNNGNGARAGANAPYNYYLGAAHSIDAIFEAVDRSEVAMVSWAQLLSVNNAANDPYGIISPDGYEKAIYNALKIYQDMPVWRYDISPERQDGVRSVVSSDKDKISILLWNTNNSLDDDGNLITTGDRTVNVKVNNAKFTSGDRKVYRIDKDHASFYDNTLTPGLSAQNLKHVNLGDGDSVWSGTVPAEGTVYITINKNELGDEFEYVDDFTFEKNNDFANDIKIQYWHEDRYRDLKGNREEYADFRDGITGTYSHFDRKQWKMYLGMGSLAGNEAGSYIGQGVANGAVICDDVPTKFKVHVDMDSKLRYANKYSSFGMRIDFYDDETGEYTDSAYFHNGIYKPKQNPNNQDRRLADFDPYPWGTKKFADQELSFDSCLWDIDLADVAPAGWINGNRKAIISFDMRNAGEGARASMQLIK
ncbi:MAG: hypothetical protein K5694_00615 [Bacilli bacterium]|nr:hypothetical protein [Bacilli bacterium]